MSRWRTNRVLLNSSIKAIAALPHSRAVRQAWTMTAHDVQASQLARFLRVYKHARCRVPFYRDRPGLYPAPTALGGELSEMLHSLPVLAKAEVKLHNEHFWADGALPWRTMHATSGTTGTPLRIVATPWEHGLTHEILGQWYARHIGTRRPRALYLSGFCTPDSSSAELCWTDASGRNAYLSIYGLTPSRRPEVMAFLRRYRPQLISGYASAVYQLSRLAGGAMTSLRDRSVSVLTSEVLQPHWRDAIEATLSRRALDMYGSQEGAHLVLQCEVGGMHIHPLIGIVEILDDQNRPTSPGAAGRVVVTSLSRRSMPLLRYDIGDSVLALGHPTDCSCGLAWPLIGAVQGRADDLIHTRDGRRISLLCFHATRDLRDIREAQLVQTDYDHIVCHLVPESIGTFQRAACEAHVRTQIRRRLGTEIDVSFRYLDAIPRGANGKFKAVVVALPLEAGQ